jgi:hypothetical protein
VEVGFMAADGVRLEGRVALVGAGEHPHAVRRLRQAMPGIEWLDAEGRVPDAIPTVELTRAGNRAEGSFALEVADGPLPRIRIEGGPFSGVIYGVEELIQKRVEPSGRGYRLLAGADEQTPGLAYRTYWNWDHSTNWDLEQTGIQDSGVMNAYAKPADGFLRDFKRCVDFMSRNRNLTQYRGRAQSRSAARGPLARA